MTHLTRAKATKMLPISRKGTKYLARGLSHVRKGVPVVIAIRDMLKLASTSKEVKHMVNDKAIKINGKVVKDIKESIRLFNILEADKNYRLSILHTGRFHFEELKENEKTRLCKIIGKTVLKGKKIQLNLHDGTNILVNLEESKKFKIGDSVELDLDGKIKKFISLKKGEDFFVIEGKNTGLSGRIESLECKKAKIKFKDLDKEVELDISNIIVR